MMFYRVWAFGWCGLSFFTIIYAQQQRERQKMMIFFSFLFLFHPYKKKHTP
jgi:hypothetical protein